MMKEQEENEEWIEAQQENIPEWKRGAIQVVDTQVPEEKKGFFSRWTNKVKSKLSSTDSAKQFYESENYKQIQEVQANYKEFRTKLSEQIEETQNPLVQGTRRVTDFVTTESTTARATKEMLKYDPEFNLNDLGYEAQEIFKEFYCNYLAGNLDYIEKVCGGPGLAIAKTEVKRRATEGWKNYYTDILDIGQTNFLGAALQEKGTPQFSFTIVVQEVDCRVDLKDETNIKHGDHDNIVQSTYRIVLSRHDEPDIAVTGHYWEIVEFNKVGELQQIV